MMKVEGQHVERRRRENRGAVGAEDRGAERGRVWGGGCAPSPEFFLIFYLGMLHFWCDLMHFQA